MIIQRLLSLQVLGIRFSTVEGKSAGRALKGQASKQVYQLVLPDGFDW